MLSAGRAFRGLRDQVSDEGAYYCRNLFPFMVRIY